MPWGSGDVDGILLVMPQIIGFRLFDFSATLSGALYVGSPIILGTNVKINIFAGK